MDSDEITDSCLFCDGVLVDEGFKGDYRQLVCEDCGRVRERPVGDVSEDGVTMEDLQNLSEF